MNVMAGQPDGATREEMRRHLNQDSGAPGGAPPPPPPAGGAPHPGGAPRPAGVLPPRCAPPPPLPWGAPRQRGAPPRRQVASSHHSPPANDSSDSDHDEAITLVHLYVVTCMVALGVLARLVVVVLRRVLEELLDKEIWLWVWVLVWEMQVVARKVMREVPRETMIPGMLYWGGGGSSSRVLTWAVGGTPGHPAGTGRSGDGVSSRTLRMPVQPTCDRGCCCWSRARRHSAGPGGSGWSTGGGRMPSGSGGGGVRAGAGPGGSTIT